MDDNELTQIRQARLDQLKAQAGNSKNVSGLDNSELQKQDEKEKRNSLLAQILEPEAADRLGRVRLVKESRALDIENRLIALARSGQLRSKVTETQLKELLGAVAETKEQEKIVVSRRKGQWPDDFNDLDEFM
ncbi:hypothetical protein HI914_04229 [Erysiphe necator]|nr:hypothetical protein HI914_04229 [Erysiphe necator]